MRPDGNTLYLISDNVPSQITSWNFFEYLTPLGLYPNISLAVIRDFVAAYFS